jgi:hypothetical protein
MQCCDRCIWTWRWKLRLPSNPEHTHLQCISGISACHVQKRISFVMDIGRRAHKGLTRHDIHNSNCIKFFVSASGDPARLFARTHRHTFITLEGTGGELRGHWACEAKAENGSCRKSAPGHATLEASSNTTPHFSCMASLPCGAARLLHFLCLGFDLFSLMIPHCPVGVTGWVGRVVFIAMYLGRETER